MPVFSRVNVPVTATRILATDGNRKSALVVNRGTADIYVAGSEANATVTGAASVLLRPQEQLTITGDPTEIWAIASTGVQVVHIVEVG